VNRTITVNALFSRVKMHQNLFDGRAQPVPAEERTLRPLTGLRGNKTVGMGGAENKGVKGKRRKKAVYCNILRTQQLQQLHVAVTYQRSCGLQIIVQ